MIKLHKGGTYLINGKPCDDKEVSLNQEEARKGTIAYSILNEHSISDDPNNLKIKFDALASHDITYVGIIQTAIASGLEKFLIPYVLTNCHNSLCAVGGTINEDDHKFALSAAKRFGGIYVPPNLAVIHQYMRENMAGCGKMILGSDSHTRYGAIGTLAIGEGGGELVKQLLGRTYDIALPEVVGIYLTGKPYLGVGPQDVALTIIKAVFKNGYVKNKIMEFFGEGVDNISMEYRNGIDVMTTETACLSSIWTTDDKTKEFLEIHGRDDQYKQLNPKDIAYYDGMIEIDLSKVKPMIAFPYHPSNVYSIEEFKENAEEILNKIDNENPLQLKLSKKFKNGEFYVEQGVVAGCAGGTFENICEISQMLDGKSIGNDMFSMSVYPSSQPTYIELVKNGCVEKLMSAGVIVHTAFCGPCFGACDIPANNELSMRHTTRNFPNREGSKPTEGQQAAVCLMDARSIAATAINGGRLTAATELFDYTKASKKLPYKFNKEVYENRIYDGTKSEVKDYELIMGPNIKEWPEFSNLTKNILLKVSSYITDDVTTTDELIPSGESSSYRSNPYKLSELTLSRKDPQYVGRAKQTYLLEKDRQNGLLSDELSNIFKNLNISINETSIGSVIFANKPGDGSAREQAASCQRVLGGVANIAKDYATKRYRSNLINWGILPFMILNEPNFQVDDYILIKDIVTSITNKDDEIVGQVIRNCKIINKVILKLGNLTDTERQILLDGCLINYYAVK